MEDIPELSFLSLNVDTATNPSQSATENHQQGERAHASNPSPCPAQPPGFGKHTCAGDGLGDSWGGGVGAGWGGGLGLWGGLRGSLDGAREFLGHLKAYLGFYYREEAAMLAPLVEARRNEMKDCWRCHDVYATCRTNPKTTSTFFNTKPLLVAGIT